VSGIHQPVGFPLGIVEFGDHIARDRPGKTQGLDLVLEAPKLGLLCRLDKVIKLTERTAKSRVAEPCFDAMGQTCAVIPVVAAFKPPWFAAILFMDITGMGEPPDAEFRDDQRLLTGTVSVAVWGKTPSR